MKAQSGMYRTPRDPGGFPFGYNWRATGVGLVLLVGFNFLATQYIAGQFRYQPALGTPLRRLSRSAVYQPFAWCVWGFRNCTSRDSRIRKPLFEGEMIVLGGCILIDDRFFVAANRRAQRLIGERRRPSWLGTLGDAGGHRGDWVDAERRPACTSVAGTTTRVAGTCKYLRHNGPEHVLAFRADAVRQRRRPRDSDLLAWDESAVIYDIKGENWAKTAGFRSSRGHLCFKFSPVEDGTSSRFNPLAEVRLVYAARRLGRSEHRRHDYP